MTTWRLRCGCSPSTPCRCSCSSSSAPRAGPGTTWPGRWPTRSTSSPAPWATPCWPRAPTSPPRLEANARRALGQGLALVVPAATVIVVGAPWILRLFGADYATEGTRLLQLLAAVGHPPRGHRRLRQHRAGPPGHAGHHHPVRRARRGRGRRDRSAGSPPRRDRRRGGVAGDPERRRPVPPRHPPARPLDRRAADPTHPDPRRTRSAPDRGPPAAPRPTGHRRPRRPRPPRPR